MTDLRDKLEHAAGDEPALTDHDLAADLARGRSASRRRRAVAATGLAGVAAATAVAIGAALALVPGSDPAGTSVQPPAAGSATASVPVKGATTDPGPTIPTRPPMIWAGEPVALVPNHKVAPGARITCDLMPKGWIFGTYKDYKVGDDIWVRDPTSTYPHEDPPGFFDGWESGDGNSVDVGPFGDKVGKGWDAQVNAHVDGKQASVFTDKGHKVTGRPSELFVRLDKRSTVQAEIGPRTGWDVKTALRWSASCHPVG